MNDVLREFRDGACNFLIEMLGPDDLSCVFWHVSDDGRVRFLIVKDPLDDFQLTGVVGQDGVVLGGKVVLEGVSFYGVFKFLQEVNGLFNAFRFAEVVVNELLKLSIELGDGDVEGDILFIKVAVGQVKQIALTFGFELISNAVELTDDNVHFLKVEFGQRIELLNVREHLNQFLESLDKLIELVEDLGL